MREPDEAVTRPAEDDPTVAEPLGRKSRSSMRAAPAGEAEGGPSGARPARRTRGSSSRATTISNPSDAARWDEIARTRALSVLGVVGSLSLSVVAPFFDVDRRILAVLLIGMALLFVSNAYLFWVCSRLDRYTEGRLVVIWVVATIGILGAVFFFGPLTAATGILILGLYIAARNESRRVARATYLTMAFGHALFVFAPLFLPIPHLGVIEASTLPLTIRVAGEGMVQLIFFGTYMAASQSQRAMMRILDELDGAVREVARREVLFEEAREALGRVLPVGGAGRLTGVELGSYRLGVLIGRGGMGEVYEATALADDAPAAVKVLQSSLLSNEQGVLRFLREARIASSLDSPHVVRVHEIGEPPDEIPYIAMERLRGHDLATHLRERGAMMEWAEVVELLRQVARGLAAAHEAGIVHRDIKPQNLYRVRADEDADAVWKLLDFGVSKLRGSEGTLTHGQLLGTPAYMAPEQALGEDVDARADLYSLGAVAYRCLVGRPPFRGGETAAVVYRVVHTMPLQPSAHAHLHPDVDLALAIALAKAPERRFESGEELATALEAAVRGALPTRYRKRGRRLLNELPWSLKR